MEVSKQTLILYSQHIAQELIIFLSFLLEKCNEADFSAKLEKLYAHMAELEIGKESPPKFSKAVRGLTKFLGIQLDKWQLLQ